jgi:hypothetical protein
MITLQALRIPRLAAALVLALGACTAGCEQDGPFEEAGENVDEAVENAGDEVEEAADEVEDEVDG